MNTSRKMVDVVAGVLYDDSGAFLLSSRPEGKPYAGYWEFAGGKVEPGETELVALQREFQEELGINVQHATPWLVRVHDYEHARVHVHFYRIAHAQWQGELQSREGQEWRWQRAGHKTVAPMLPANQPILAALAIPTRFSGNLRYGFSGLGDNSQSFRVQPWRQAEQACDALLVPFAELNTASCQHLAKPIWALLDDSSQWPLVQDVAAAVWSIQNHDDAAALETILQQGCSLPLLALTDGKTLADYGRQWLNMGLHGVITTDHTAPTTLV